ncbi:BON domain-containing protein [Thalassoroseus pseudoceratinae]|uniref:hypothetical protein n=1 Tax=Thalassoroseus pseudoceratinae TaxID=2713176 RepID=UPI00141F6358|nr:hypothetical protein [Thalassoroseus pseudoceratinae]
MSVPRGNQLDGQMLRRQVLRSLQCDGHPELSTLDVEVGSGCVLVSGVVSSFDAKQLALSRVCRLGDVDAARFEISVSPTADNVRALT